MFEQIETTNDLNDFIVATGIESYSDIADELAKHELTVSPVMASLIMSFGQKAVDQTA